MGQDKNRRPAPGTPLWQTPRLWIRLSLGVMASTTTEQPLPEGWSQSPGAPAPRQHLSLPRPLGPQACRLPCRHARPRQRLPLPDSAALREQPCSPFGPGELCAPRQNTDALGPVPATRLGPILPEGSLPAVLSTCKAQCSLTLKTGRRGAGDPGSVTPTLQTPVHGLRCGCAHPGPAPAALSRGGPRWGTRPGPSPGGREGRAWAKTPHFLYFGITWVCTHLKHTKLKENRKETLFCSLPSELPGDRTVTFPQPRAVNHPQGGKQAVESEAPSSGSRGAPAGVPWPQTKPSSPLGTRARHRAWRG